MAITQPGNRIYHYCKLCIATKYILPRQQLLLAPLKNTNDPRENKSFVFATTSLRPLPNWEERNAEISEILREDCKLICFSRDDRYFGYESSRMWAYYGGNHKGLCLELDRDEFIRENANVIDPNLLRDVEYYEFDYKWTPHKKVDYTIAEQMGLTSYLHNIFRQEHMQYLYFTKNKEWESEREVRLINFSGNTQNEYCSIKRSLRNIFCGVDFDQSELAMLATQCSDTDINLLKYKDVRLEATLVHAGNQNEGTK